MNHSNDSTPYGIGRVRTRWLLIVVALVTLILIGIYSYSHEYIEGIGVGALKNLGDGGGAAWGIYIVMDIFFVGLAFTGLVFACVVRLFRVRHLLPLCAIAEALALSSIIGAACCVVADLGRPLDGLLLLPKFARPFSPFFGTFTFVVSGYVFASVTLLYLSSRQRIAALDGDSRLILSRLHKIFALGYRDSDEARQRTRRVGWWLSLALLPFVVTAQSTLGYVFGIQVGRPGWYGGLQGPEFLAVAFLSGLGILIVVTQGLVRYVPEFGRHVTNRVNETLGRTLWLASSVTLYFMISDYLAARYAGTLSAQRVLESATHGPYAIPFYLSIGLLLVALTLPLYCFVRKTWPAPVLVTAGLCAAIGAVLKRHLLVASSQTHGSLLGDRSDAYVPAWGEILVVVGITCVVALLLMTIVKLVPIGPIGSDPTESETTRPPQPRDRPRLIAALSVAVLGVTLSILGVANSPGLVPRSGIAYAPVMMVVGLIFCFGSAVVYDAWPDRQRGN